METSVSIKIPGADCGEIKIGELFCYFENGLYSRNTAARSEFASSVERYIVRDQHRTVQCIDVNENTTECFVYDEAIRSNADLLIVDFQKYFGLQVLSQFCEDLKAIAAQFRVRILVMAKIQINAAALSVEDLPPEIREAADLLLLGTIENSRQVIGIAKSRNRERQPGKFG